MELPKLHFIENSMLAPIHIASISEAESSDDWIDCNTPEMAKTLMAGLNLLHAREELLDLMTQVEDMRKAASVSAPDVRIKAVELAPTVARIKQLLMASGPVAIPDKWKAFAAQRYFPNSPPGTDYAALFDELYGANVESNLREVLIDHKVSVPRGDLIKLTDDMYWLAREAAKTAEE